MARDNSPVKNTCPLINRAQSNLESLVDLATDDDCNDKARQIRSDSDVLLEEVREANSALRSWGNDLFKMNEELEEEKRKTEYEVEKLTKRITELEEQVERLEWAAMGEDL